MFAQSTPVVRLLSLSSQLSAGAFRSVPRFDPPPALDGGRSYMKESAMPSGTVKWFNAQKGYGFIQPDDGSKDVFVHISAVERAGLSHINENQKITYELERGQQGKTSAVNLQTE
jgi:cold shock protein